MVRLAVLLALLLLLEVNVSQGARAHEGAAGPMFEDAPIVLAPYTGSPSVVVDGKVEAGEYSSYGTWTDAASAVTLDLVHDNDSLFVAVVEPTPGWIAFGFSTDLDSGMGFLALGQVNNTWAAAELVAMNVSDELTFSSVSPSGLSALEAFNVTQQGSVTTAEFKVSMNSTLWTFESGEIVPTILAFNTTTPTLPRNAAASEVHPLRTYPLRPEDDLAAIQKLFMEDISPIPGLVAVGTVAVGVTAILAAFVRGKESK